MTRAEDSWRELLARLQAQRPWRSLVVLGPTDAGKTTLCRFLGRALAQQGRAAVVDCDPGQSVLGLPSTLGLAWEPWEGAGPLALRFVGATTPARHFLQTLTGIRRLAERGVELGAERLVFDSSGYDESPAGREFHYQILDLLEPDHLVVLQRGGEMEPLLACFERRARPRVHRLPVSEAAVPRTPAARRAYRQQRFARYLQGAVLCEVALEGVGFHGMIPPVYDRSSFRKRLVALCDGRGFALVLGVVEALDGDAGRLRVYAPPFDPGRVASVQFGSIHLNRGGQELHPSQRAAPRTPLKTPP